MTRTSTLVVPLFVGLALAGCHHGDDDAPAAQHNSGDVANAGAHDQHAGQPAPTFWTLLESELTQVGVTHQQIQQLEAMWHYA